MFEATAEEDDGDEEEENEVESQGYLFHLSQDYQEIFIFQILFRKNPKNTKA